MPKLTKRSVELLEPKAEGYFVWDSEIKGFGIRVLPSGAKTYQIQYRKGGRTRRAAIGRHGNITAEIARAKAKELMGEVSKGENPIEEIAQHRRAPNLAALCERFYEAHVLERCKPSTQGEDPPSLPIRANMARNGTFWTLRTARRTTPASPSTSAPSCWPQAA